MKITRKQLTKLIEISLRAEPTIPGYDPTNTSDAKTIRKVSKLARGSSDSEGFLSSQPK